MKILQMKLIYSLLCFTVIATCCFLVTYSRTRLTLLKDEFSSSLPYNDELIKGQFPRMVAFGSSRTWGANIANRNQDSYAALLGAQNLGIRASGPEYPALCTYSMLKDGNNEGYDVIILEYSITYFDTEVQALPILAQRLKERYPTAVIIFLSIWMPKEYVHISTHLSLDSWARKNCPAKCNNEQFLTCLQSKSMASDWDFHHTFGTNGLKSIAEHVGGHVISLEKPTSDAIETLKQHARLYTFDMTHFSEEGHMWVKDKVLELLSTVKKERSNSGSSILQPWKHKDICTTWFDSGNLEESLNTTMPIHEFGDGKFALEVVDESSENMLEIKNSAWLVNGNNAKIPYHHVYISYMAGGPEQIYPIVELFLYQGDDVVAHRILDPKLNHAEPLHLVSHRYLGKITTNAEKEGMSITIHQLNKTDAGDEKDNALQHFRITGIIVTPYQFGDNIKAAY